MIPNIRNNVAATNQYMKIEILKGLFGKFISTGYLMCATHVRNPVEIAIALFACYYFYYEHPRYLQNVQSMQLNPNRIQEISARDRDRLYDGTPFLRMIWIAPNNPLIR